jgi:hypothetical protein
MGDLLVEGFGCLSYPGDAGPVKELSPRDTLAPPFTLAKETAP